MAQRTSPFLRTKALLFDLLSDKLDTDPTTSAGYIGLTEVKHSIIEQLEHLLNARLRDAQKSQLSVVDFGIPDFSAYSIGDSTQMHRLVRSIEQAIATFEPRLRNVRAELVSADPRSLNQALQIRLSAQLHVEPLTDDLRLYLVLSGKFGTVSIHEREPS
jgi:type VI secretion system protein ImpF